VNSASEGISTFPQLLNILGDKCHVAFSLGSSPPDILGLTRITNFYFMFYDEKAMTSSGFFNC